MKETHKSEISQLQAVINEADILKIKQETEASIRTEYENQLNELKAQHEQSIEVLHKEQKRIQQEMEKLTQEHSKETDQLKSEFEAQLKESTENEKVKKKKKK